MISKKEELPNGGHRVYVDNVLTGAFHLDNLYLDFFQSGAHIPGSGTFKAGSEGEVKLLSLIRTFESVDRHMKTMAAGDGK